MKNKKYSEYIENVVNKAVIYLSSGGVKYFTADDEVYIQLQEMALQLSSEQVIQLAILQTESELEYLRSL